MQFSVLTLFPQYFQETMKCSLLGRALERGLLEVSIRDLRQYGHGPHRHVDETQFGGGPECSMPTVVEAALLDLLGEQGLQDLEDSVKNKIIDKDIPYVVYLSPQGKLWSSELAKQYRSDKKHVILICGHYEGMDQRAIDTFVHEEISIGDYILTGGEPAALVLMDSMARFLDGVVGNQESVQKDSFEGDDAEMVPGGLRSPAFTRPRDWKGQTVPEVLFSGNHAEIAKWRRNQSLKRTQLRRPDLLSGSHQLTVEE